MQAFCAGTFPGCKSLTVPGHGQGLQICHPFRLVSGNHSDGSNATVMQQYVDAEQVIGSLSGFMSSSNCSLSDTGIVCRNGMFKLDQKR